MFNSFSLIIWFTFISPIGSKFGPSFFQQSLDMIDRYINIKINRCIYTFGTQYILVGKSYPKYDMLNLFWVFCIFSFTPSPKCYQVGTAIVVLGTKALFVGRGWMNKNTDTDSLQGVEMKLDGKSVWDKAFSCIYVASEIFLKVIFLDSGISLNNSYASFYRLHKTLLCAFYWDIICRQCYAIWRA